MKETSCSKRWLAFVASAACMFSIAAYADTTTFKVSASNSSWQSTGIRVKAGDTIKFSASGTVVHWKSRDGKEKQTCGPDGVTGTTSEDVYLTPGLRKMGLVGKIGNQIFDVGSSAEISAQHDGTIMLGINDTNKAGGCADNEGSWSVKITK